MINLIAKETIYFVDEIKEQTIKFDFGEHSHNDR